MPLSSNSITTGGSATIGVTGSSPIAPPSYSWTTATTPVAGTGITISAIPKNPLKMEISIADTGDGFRVTFYDDEGGQRVNMLLEPEPDITPREALHLNVLLASVTSMAMAGAPTLSNLKALAYARKHNIARHFKLSIA